MRYYNTPYTRQLQRRDRESRRGSSEPFEGREVEESGKGIGTGTVPFARIENALPRMAPKSAGVSFESAAHRVSAVRKTEGSTENCVYVPRRDVSSRVCATLGESLLPAELNCGDFRVAESDGICRIRLNCGEVFAGVEVRETESDKSGTTPSSTRSSQRRGSSLRAASSTRLRARGTTGSNSARASERWSRSRSGGHSRVSSKASAANWTQRTR